jgi:hypothetical protein
LLGGADGNLIFESMIAALQSKLAKAA